jgi:AraC family transcriptional regulator
MTSQPIRIETSAPIILAGRNATYAIGPQPGMKDQWASFMQDFGQIEGQIGLNAFGVCHAFDGKGQMDYMAAAQVSDGGQVPGYLHVLQIPARKVAVFLHEGPLEKISETWGLIFNTWLPAAKLEVAYGPQFEIYGEAFNGGREEIEIHIPVK